MTAIIIKRWISKCYLATRTFQPISSNNQVTENSKVPFTSHPKAAQLFVYTHTHTHQWVLVGVTTKTKITDQRWRCRTNVIYKDLLENISSNSSCSSYIICVQSALSICEGVWTHHCPSPIDANYAKYANQERANTKTYTSTKHIQRHLE